MHLRTVLYIFTMPCVIWALESININNLFKKNKYWQARILFVMVSMALTYLVVNFFMDFFTSTKLY